MAYNYTDAVFGLKGLNPTDKLVLLHLAEHADKDTGECWPGFGRLADFTGLTRRTVIYSIKRLADLEFITVNPPTAERKTNTYLVRMDKLVGASTATPGKRAKRRYTKKPEPKTLADLYTIGRNVRTKEIVAYWCKGCNHRADDITAFARHVIDKHEQIADGLEFPEEVGELMMPLTKEEIQFLDEGKTTDFDIEA